VGGDHGGDPLGGQVEQPGGRDHVGAAPGRALLGDVVDRPVAGEVVADEVEAGRLGHGGGRVLDAGGLSPQGLGGSWGR
jgi:hypothetical protein